MVFKYSKGALPFWGHKRRPPPPPLQTFSPPPKGGLEFGRVVDLLPEGFVMEQLGLPPRHTLVRVPCGQPDTPGGRP